MHHEQNFTVQEILNASTMPSQPYGSLMPSAQPGRLSMVRRVPVGVVGAITPWNSPSVLGMRVVAPALALGNAVVLKPDPQTPVAGGAMFAAVFARGRPARGAAAGRRRRRRRRRGDRDRPERRRRVVHRIDRRRPPGRRAGRAAAQEGLARARRQQRVRRARRRRPRRRGLGRRVRLVPVPGPGLLRRRPAHRPPERGRGDYVDALVEKARRLRLGDPYREDVDLGPIVNERQLARVDGIVRRSIEGGARLVVGGTHEGLFYRPTVLADVTTDLPAWTDEIFGPVAPVVTFDTDDEALALANAAEYGLAGAVYSRSISRGLALAQRIRSGMVHVNDQTVNDEAIIPFGGMGASGNGARFGGAANWDEFTQWQWVTVRDEPRSFPYPY